MVFPPRGPGNFFQSGMQPNNFMFPQQAVNQMPQGGIQGLIQRFLQPGSSITGGAANSVGGMGGITNTLNNVQQVLKMVESTAPVIKQYGPMVKNLPAMYKMMKAFKDLESTEGDEEESSTKESSAKESSSQDDLDSIFESTDESLSLESSVQPVKRRSGNGQSTPKLFI
ncbi:VrrA/YqfQ family protein [Ornithinibacillus salinisoli]|uniref:VrrA/YqfQ family protein n=1 Tax=Ornithinibacillus salinisoli TaxID=1848459 RepID=A0ABW4W4T8_9BACI